MDKMVSWQRNATPQATVDEMTGVVPSARTLDDRDVQFLEALLRYNFLTSALAKRLWQMSDKFIGGRFRRLYDWGLVNRGALSQKRGNRKFVYSLSRQGFEVLMRIGNPFAEDWGKDWMPRSETGSQRLSVLHELGCNEVCIALGETAQALKRPVISWEGPREAVQRFSTASGWHTLSPDAILTLENGQPLFIEFERSGRDSKLYDKAKWLRIFLLSGQWQERYHREPWVVYAIPFGKGTQGVIGGSFGGSIAHAAMKGVRNYLVLDEEAWTQGTWLAFKNDGTMVNLWDVI